MNQIIKSQVNYIDFSENQLSLEKFSKVILKELDSTGYVVLRNFNVDVANINECKHKLLEISELIGNPIGHDANNKIIWDIKSNPKSDSFIKTYSEHSHEAELHTDSQYSNYPEDYFNLLTLKKADCGGGLSYLISLKDILEELKGAPNGLQIEKTLRETNYPFIVPNVFKKSQKEGHEFNFGPILRDQEIRFRIDTIEKAIAYDATLCSAKQIDVFKAFKHLILSSKRKIVFHLEPKDLIFINNKSMLHGRSPFTDNQRHLLRIRMNKKSYNPNC